MNVYSELWELLRPREAGAAQVCFGVLSGVEPLEVTVGEAPVRTGLRYPRGMTFLKESIGRELALLALPDGFLILFQVEGGGNT